MSLRIQRSGLIAGGRAEYFDPLTAPDMFALYRESAVDAGSGACSQWSDLTAGARHATQVTGGNRPAISASDPDFNGHPSLTFTTDDYLTAAAASAWPILHSTADATYYLVFRPAGGAGIARRILSTIADPVSTNHGINVYYNATRQTLDFFVGNGTGTRCVTLIGADNECPANVSHVLVIRKRAAGWEAWLNGALILKGEWNGVPSSTNPSRTVMIGGSSDYAATQQFEGKIAEFGVRSAYTDPAIITAYARTRYGLSATRTPTHRVLFKDGVNVGAGIDPAGARVWSYFTLASSTPGATQNVALVINRTGALSVQTKSNGEPFPVPVGGGISDRRVVLTAESLTSVPALFSQPKPIKALLVIGESVASGRSSETGLPVGYLPTSDVYMVDNEMQVVALDEPTDPATAYHVDGTLAGSGTPGVGPAGLLTWYMSQEDPDSCWLLANCGVGSATSTTWAAGTSRAAFGATCARILALNELALTHGRTVEWVGIYLDQGINDAVSASPTWDTNWTAIETAFRSAVSLLSTVPIVYRVECAEVPTDTSYPGWATVISQQQGWAKATVPKRIPIIVDPLVDYVEAGHVHPGTAANIDIAEAARDVFVTELGL